MVRDLVLYGFAGGEIIIFVLKLVKFILPI